MAGLTEALLPHVRIGLDTPVFIYHLEDIRPFSDQSALVFRAIDDGAVQAVTSMLTLLELLVQPLRQGRPDVADEYQAFLSSYPNLTMVGTTTSVARLAAELRAAHGIGAADALQIATSIDRGATAFLTNDRRLQRIGEIRVLLISEFVDQ